MQTAYDGHSHGEHRAQVPWPGARVDGAILFGLNDRDISILDGYEETPSLYTREPVEAIGAAGKQIRCWIYMPTGWERG